VQRGMVCALVTLVPALGHADGIAIVGGSPRAIGRAGAATVGDDGGGALLINPAAMARRDTTRAEIGAAMVDDTVQWQHENTLVAPLSVGRAGSQIAPLGAAIAGVGDWIFGAGVMTAAVTDRSLPRPSDAHGDLRAAYEYRYAGIAGSYRRDTLSLAAARRLGDSVALGVALGASRITGSEHRRIWAGLGAVDAPGSPIDDVDVALSGRDPFSPSAIVGVLYAPVDSQIELGASVGWARTVHLDGTLTAMGTATGPMVVSVSPHASLEVRQPLAVRGGGRYVGDRIVAELDGDLWLAASGSGSTAWSVQGMTVVDPSQATVDLSRVPSRIAQHTHVALRTAVDVALIPGFLWATGGYAFSTRATPASRLSPSFGDLGGHTFGLGLEAMAGGVTATLGWSRTWAQRTMAPSELYLDNPLSGPDAPVPAGTYSGSIDQVGLLLEIELGEH
jgi:hypothetical protein